MKSSDKSGWLFNRRQAAMAAATALMVAVCGSLPAYGVEPNSNEGTTSLTMGVSPGSGNTTLVEVADQQGFFEKAGLKVSTITVSSGPAAVTALATGALQAVPLSVSVITPLIDKGKAFQLISGQTRTITVLMASPELAKGLSWPESVRALKGHKIGITALSSTTQYMTQSILEAAGLSAKDVTFVATGHDADKALMAGHVDAAMVFGRQITRLADRGYPILVDQRSAEACPAGLQPCGISLVGVWADADWVKKNPATVVKIQGALAMADMWLHAPENREKVEDFFGSQLGGDRDPAAVKVFTDESLKLLTAAYPEHDLAEWFKFDRKNGAISKDLPAKDSMAAGVPQNESEVTELAQSFAKRFAD